MTVPVFWIFFQFREERSLAELHPCATQKAPYPPGTDRIRAEHAKIDCTTQQLKARNFGLIGPWACVPENTC